MAIVRRSSSLLATTFLLVFLSASTISARPCKTLFITFSIHTIPLHNPNPNLNNFIFTDKTQSISITDGLFIIDRSITPDFEFDRPRRIKEHKTPSFYNLMLNEWIDIESVLERSKDVISVVVALLFGVGCGAITAATMYFAWMFVVGFREEDYDDEEEEEKEGVVYMYDEIPSPKMGEYVKIPQADVAQAKEVV